MYYQAILWDVDGTLLDFEKSERYGILSCMEEFGIEGCDDAMLRRYAEINRVCWEALERGEMTKPEVLVGRFRRFFAQEGIFCKDVEGFNDSYQRKLGEIFFENEKSVALCRRLHGKICQCVITNGTIEAQREKLKGSGLGAYMDGIFISDEIGVEKPGIGFFQPVLELLKGIDPKRILVVGDSLTSDMKGGNNIGASCCWYNPRKKKNMTEVRVDYEISKLWDVEKILEID